MTSPRLVEIETPLGPAHAHVSRPVRAKGTVVLTHGASGRLTGADLLAVRDGLVEAGWAVAFVQQAWGVAGKRMPPRPVPQDAAWLPVVESLRSGRSRLPGPLVLAGKSNGARVACRTASTLGADGVLCQSFPLHPPGKPEVSRADELRMPVESGIALHVVQGERDPFGSPDEVRAELDDPAYVSAVKGEHTIRATGPLVAAAVEFVSSLV